ncbi:MAG: hypothetical protein EAX96_00160 [Candidatus Lokiarchaeota archaeon]|nr:hypothetical protein [Candidatus Lokiarchaeota archaeon]
MLENIIKFAVTSDVHAPKYLNLFAKSLARIKNIDFFLFGGDMIFKGDIKQYDKIIDLIRRRFDCPIIGVFGNEEFDELREKIKQEYSEISFLMEESKILKINGVSIGFIGTTGSLDELTWWQSKNKPENVEIFKNRIKKVDKLFQNLRANVRILLSHYAVSYKTMRGETIFAYPQLGSREYEQIILKYQPKFVFHGHAHRGLSHVTLRKTIIFNVAMPLLKKIKVINLKTKMKNTK